MVGCVVAATAAPIDRNESQCLTFPETCVLKREGSAASVPTVCAEGDARQSDDKADDSQDATSRVVKPKATAARRRGCSSRRLLATEDGQRCTRFGAPKLCRGH